MAAEKSNVLGGDIQSAYVIPGSTSGMGLRTALALAKHGVMLLVGLDRRKLDGVKELIERRG